MGADLLGLILILLILCGLGFGIYRLCKYLLRRAFSQFSGRRISLLSVLATVILVPVILIILFWVFVAP